MPTGNAAARHELDNSSPGIIMNCSSAAYSYAGTRMQPRKTMAASIAIVSSKVRMPGDALLTKVDIRMCSPRRNAMTAPSMASQMNIIWASSSDQINGA